MLEANKPESECIMKFSDEIATNYSRHHDLLQEAEHVRLLRQAQNRPHLCSHSLRYLQVEHLQERRNRINVSQKKTGKPTQRYTSPILSPDATSLVTTLMLLGLWLLHTRHSTYALEEAQWQLP